MVEEPDCDGADCDAAWMVTVAGSGRLEGAAYTPAEVIVPQAAPEHPGPVTLHVIAADPIPFTVAKKGCCELTDTRALAGVTLITSGRMMVTAADADLVVSTVEVAVMVICGDAGTVAGAL